MQEAGFAISIAALLVLPSAAYTAGRGIRQRLLFATAALLVAVGQLITGIIGTQAVEGALDGGWGRGDATMGEFVAFIGSIQNLVNAAMVAALLLAISRAAQARRA